ncbi:MAG TPA: hypothetical protein VGB50_07840 [Flavobacterium sp.]|jgi:hypothetical protein
MNFTKKYLTIRGKFKGDGTLISFKKNDIMSLFRELGHKVKYDIGSNYMIERQYGAYRFVINIRIVKSSPFTSIYIYKDDKVLEADLTNFSYMLNFLPYDESLINKNFGINSLLHMKSYLQQIIALCDEIIDECIKEIEAGNTPD